MSIAKFAVQKNATLGRYVTATKRINPGEVILTEKPVIVVPQWDSPLLCSNCFRESNIICRRCAVFPLCLSCLEHDALECDFFKDLPKDKKNFLIDDFQLFAIVKCLLLNESDNSKENFNAIIAMESHMVERRGSLVWKVHEAKLYEPIMKLELDKLFKSSKINLELIEMLAGVLDINAFEIRGKCGDTLRGIYPNCALLAHDCIANTQISVDPDNLMKIYARTAIEENEMIYYSYTSPLLGTNARRDHLMDGKCFLCSCKRCMDPSELGTNMSSLTCSSCHDSLMMLKNDTWTCCSCKYEKEGLNVRDMLDRFSEEIMDADGDLQRMEMLIIKLTPILNPNHYLVLDLKQKVASMIRQIIASAAGKVGPAVLKRKIKLCEEILNVLRIVQPGISRLTGIALYEYVMPFIQLSQNEFENSAISASDYRTKLETAEKMLKESAGMLVYDHPLTPEGQLAKTALTELKQLRTEIYKISNTERVATIE